MLTRHALRSFLVATALGAAFGGCRQTQSEDRDEVADEANGVADHEEEGSDDDGVSVDALGIHVKVGDEGVAVKVPGVDVKVGDKGVAVTAPGVDVRVNEQNGVAVQAPAGVNVRVGGSTP